MLDIVCSMTSDTVHHACAWLCMVQLQHCVAWTQLTIKQRQLSMQDMVTPLADQRTAASCLKQMHIVFSDALIGGTSCCFQLLYCVNQVASQVHAALAG